MEPEIQPLYEESRLGYLTGNMAGIGGRYKVWPEDFWVEEVPLYPPSGKGTHVYALLEKKGITTPEALGQIARALGVKRQAIGFAGMKDAQAVTRQWISVEHIDSRRLREMSLPKIKIGEIFSHTNKIKLGHLAGNRFVIRIREMEVSLHEAQQRTEKILAVLQARGVPNYFGPQRFGNRRDGHRLGYALLKGRIEEFMDLFLGKPREEDAPAVRQARQKYETQDYAGARKAWPYSYRDARLVLRALAENNGSKKRAYYVLDRTMKRFFICAYQSHLFNAVLAARLEWMDEMLSGDMAYKHENRACFRVEDAAAEQERCRRFEISPTGPILGYQMTEATGAAGEIENAILAEAGVTSRDFRQMDQYGVRGSRRPLRFQPREAQVKEGKDERGIYLELGFELEAGCYATSLLREVMKNSAEFKEEE